MECAEIRWWLLHQKQWWNFLGKNTKTSALVKNPFSICKKGQGYFSLDANKILRLQVTLYPLYVKNVITQLVLVTNKSDRHVESITQLLICWPVNILKLQSFVAWAVEMNLTWNLTGTELSLVGDQTQTSVNSYSAKWPICVDDLIINQLQAIFQLFTAYLGQQCCIVFTFATLSWVDITIATCNYEKTSQAKSVLSIRAVSRP